MANIRYFADHDGQPAQLISVYYDGRKAFGYQADALAAWKAGGPRATPIPVARIVEFKPNPSRHECDARCTHATGRVMKCECSCGGKNHGRGGAA